MTTRRFPLGHLAALAALLVLAAVVVYRTGELPEGGEPAGAASAGPLATEVYDRIEIGMAEADVAGFCGRAPDRAIACDQHPVFGVPCSYKRWELEDGQVRVWVGVDGRVLIKSYLPKGRDRP
jgi:hypothetical protein